MEINGDYTLRIRRFDNYSRRGPNNKLLKKCVITQSKQNVLLVFYPLVIALFWICFPWVVLFDTNDVSITNPIFRLTGFILYLQFCCIFGSKWLLSFLIFHMFCRLVDNSLVVWLSIFLLLKFWSYPSFYYIVVCILNKI